MKLVELGLLGGGAAFGLCFVLERDAMVRVPLTRRGPPAGGARAGASGAAGETVELEVKPLELVWRQCGGRWGPHNTLHVDDLPHTYALNPRNGVQCAQFRLDAHAGGGSGPGGRAAARGAAAAAPVSYTHLTLPTTPYV